MTRLMLAAGLAALLAAPATAATLFEASASVAISNLDAQGLTVTYISTADADATASGVFGTSAQASRSGDALIPENTVTPVPSGGLTFGADVLGMTPSNPAADSAASAFFERSVTLSFTNSSASVRQATFNVALLRFAKVVSGGLAGETPFARAAVTVVSKGVTVPTFSVVQQLLIGEAGTSQFPLNESIQWTIDVSPSTTETITYTVRAEGNSAVPAGLTPVPLPATAPLLAAALLGAGAVLRRRRAA